MTKESANGPPASRAIDLTFAAILGLGFVSAMAATRRYYFWVDDWLLVRQAGSLGGLVDHYNGHLSLLILGLYRLLIEVFGFNYLPFRIVGLLSLFAVPVTYYACNRRALSPALAAILGVSLLVGEGNSLIAVELNHSLALVGGIVCAHTLNRGRRGDAWLAGALAFSLAAAGGGLAIAAACVVHSCCTRAPRRRWAAVLGPLAVWSAWWLVVGRDYDAGPVEVTVRRAVVVAWDLTFASLSSLGLHSSILGWLLLIAYLGYGVGLVRHGLDNAANWLAWTTALLVWGAGVAFSRGSLADPHVFRYQLLALGFLLLAVVPRRPLGWARSLSPTIDHRWAVVALLLVTALQVPGFEREARESSELITRASTLTRGRIVVLGIEPEVVADSALLPLDMGGLPAGEVRSLLHRYGGPFPAGGDQELVDEGVILSIAGDDQASIECTPLTAPLLQPVSAVGVRLWSRDTTVNVEVRRFGSDWILVEEVRPREVLILRLPTLDSEVPWEVRAEGSCRLGRA